MTDLKALPKVLLHDHLDGGLRTDTILDLAADIGYRDLPATTPDALAERFDQEGSESLNRYLEPFVHTTALLQTPSALHRVAYEAVVDLADDGVVYAEIRFAPSHHQQHDLPLSEVVEAVLAGLRAGQEETLITVGAILVAMRTRTDSPQIAQLAIDCQEAGVIGFDLAGRERGHPADNHLAACQMVVGAGLPLTIHAGEDAGPESIMTAVTECGAQRIGHGVNVADDCEWSDGEIVGLGPVARCIHDQQVPLEVCVTSNLNSKGWTLDQHPIGALHRAGFNVTVNTDNRLMSRTTLTGEFRKVVAAHQFSAADLFAVTERAMNAAFVAQSVKESMLSEYIYPAYNAATINRG